MSRTKLTIDHRTREEWEQRLDALLTLRVAWDNAPKRVQRREAKYLSELDARIIEAETKLS